MKIILRKEQESDYSKVEAITREAFWNVHSPGCVEHYLMHVMHSSAVYIKELAFVAVDKEKIVGHIAYTTAHILGDDGVRHTVLSFGPVSVLPDYQGQGVGKQLIEHTKQLAKEMGYTAILIFGDPDFYKKVGFTAAEDYQIGTSWNAYAVPLLACELSAEGLKGCSGRFFEDEIYNVTQEEAEAFDKAFPFKEKLTGLPSQQRFAQLITMNRPRE